MNGRAVRVQRPGTQRAMAAVTAAVVVVALSAALRSIEASRATTNVGPAQVASVAPPTEAALHPGVHRGPTPHSLAIQAASKYQAQAGR